MSIADRPPSLAEEAAEGHGFARPNRTDVPPITDTTPRAAEQAVETKFAPGDRVRWHTPPRMEGTVLKHNGGMCKVQWDTGVVRRDDPANLRRADEEIVPRPFPIAPPVHAVVLTTSQPLPAGTASMSIAAGSVAMKIGSDPDRARALPSAVGVPAGLVRTFLKALDKRDHDPDAPSPLEIGEPHYDAYFREVYGDYLKARVALEQALASGAQAGAAGDRPGAAPAGGLPGVEEIAAALWATERTPSRENWAEMLAFTGHAGEVAAEAIAPYRTRAAAIHARLSAAGTGDAGRSFAADKITAGLDDIAAGRFDVVRVATTDPAPRPEAPARPAAADGLREAASFLLDRLAEFDDGGFSEDGFIDYNGHVTPAIGRLRAVLDAAPSADRGEAGDGWRHHRTPAQVYRCAKEDGFRAAIGIVEGEQTQRDAKGTSNKRLLTLIADRLRARADALAAVEDSPTPRQEHTP